MKIYCKADINIQPYVLSSDVDGIALTINASNLFTMGGGFNSSYVRNEIRTSINQTLKEISLEVIWGDVSGNAIWNVYPNIFMTKSHHQGVGNPKQIRLPVFFNTNYLSKVEEIVSSFAEELKEIEGYERIKILKVQGINESTSELRATAQDWTNLNNTQGTFAYQQGAQKWIDAGYNTIEVKNAIIRVIDASRNSFKDQDVSLPYIPGRNGFPCIDYNDQICTTANRPYLTSWALDYAITKEVKPMFTSLTDTTNPDSLIGIKHAQIERSVYNNSKWNSIELQKVIAYAEKSGMEMLEIHHLNVLN